MIDAKTIAAEFKSELAANAEGVKTLDAKAADMQQQINNLDASVKELANRKPTPAPAMDMKSQIIAGLEEKRESIDAFIKSKKDGSVKVEIKAATPSATTPGAYSVALDGQVHGAPVLNNAFLAAFGVQPVNSSKLAWIEASDSASIGYVNELATNSNNTDITFAEKLRKYAKVATYINLSSEIENWFAMCADYATNKVDKLLLAKIDELAFAGAGNDSTKPLEIYGIKTNGSTAFSASEKYKSANLADLIMACVNMGKKAGYNPNVAVLSYDNMAAVRGLKDSNGNYLYDQLTGMLGQVRIIPSSKIGATELLVADSSCVDIHVGGNLEIEFTRKAEMDGWRVDFRKNAQVVVPTAEKAGVIYVATIATAITAITE